MKFGKPRQYTMKNKDFPKRIQQMWKVIKKMKIRDRFYFVHEKRWVLLSNANCPWVVVGNKIVVNENLAN